MMLCGVRVEWPPHFVEEQARIAKDPQLAQKELLFLNGRLHMVESELKSLRLRQTRRSGDDSHWSVNETRNELVLGVLNARSKRLSSKSSSRRGFERSMRSS